MTKMSSLSSPCPKEEEEESDPASEGEETGGGRAKGIYDNPEHLLPLWHAPLD